MQSTNDNDLLTRSQALKEFDIPDSSFTNLVHKLGIEPVKKVSRNSYYLRSDIMKIKALYDDGTYKRVPYKPRKKRSKQGGSEESTNTTQTAQADNIAASSISTAQDIDCENCIITGSESSTLIFPLSVPNTSLSCIEGIYQPTTQSTLATVNATEEGNAFALSDTNTLSKGTDFINGNESAFAIYSCSYPSIATAGDIAEPVLSYSSSSFIGTGSQSFIANESAIETLDTEVIGCLSTTLNANEEGNAFGLSDTTALSEGTDFAIYPSYSDSAVTTAGDINPVTCLSSTSIAQGIDIGSLSTITAISYSDSAISIDTTVNTDEEGIAFGLSDTNTLSNATDFINGNESAFAIYPSYSDSAVATSGDISNSIGFSATIANDRFGQGISYSSASCFDTGYCGLSDTLANESAIETLDNEVIGCLSTTLNANEGEIGFNLSAAIISCSSSSGFDTGSQSFIANESASITSLSAACDTNLYSLSAAYTLGGISFEGNEQSVPMDSEVIGDSAISGISNSDTTDSFAQIGDSAIENSIQGISTADIMIPDSNAQGTIDSALSSTQQDDSEPASEVESAGDEIESIGGVITNGDNDSAQTKNAAEGNDGTDEEYATLFRVTFVNCHIQGRIKNCALNIFMTITGTQFAHCDIEQDTGNLNTYFELTENNIGNISGRINFRDNAYAIVTPCYSLPDSYWHGQIYNNCNGQHATGDDADKIFSLIRDLLNEQHQPPEQATPKKPARTFNQSEGYISDQQADEIKAQLNALSSAEFANLIGLQPARESGWICPICKSGSGKNGTGVTFKRYGDGRIHGQCWNDASHFSGDYLKLASIALDIPCTHEDYYRLIKEVARRLNICLDNFKDIVSQPVRQNNSQNADRRKEPNFYGWTSDFAQKEFAKAREQVTWYLNKQVNENKPVSIRGLTRPTLEYFGFGFLREYYPQPKDKQNWRLVNRLIIPIDSDPNGISHISRLLPDKNDDRLYEGYQLKPAKYRVGNLLPFNVTRINSNNPIIFLTEGEIDAASCWQASEGKYNFVGLGTDNITSSAADIFRNMPPKQFVVLMDNDKPGRDAAPKVADKLKTLGHQAVIKFLPTKEGYEKFDGNDWLIECSDYLSNRLDCIYAEAQEEFDAMDSATEEENAQIQPTEDRQPSKVDAPADTVVVDGIKLIPANVPLKKRTISDILIKDIFKGDGTDIDFSTRLEKFAGHKIRRLPQSDCWIVYDERKGLWRRGLRGSCEIVIPLATQLSKLLDKNAYILDKAETDSRQAQAQDGVIVAEYEGNRKLARSYKSAARIKASISLLVKNEDLLISLSDLDRHKSLLPCRNGVIDLEDGQLYHAAPELLLTKAVNATYRPDVDTNFVESFFKAIQPNDQTRNYLKRFLGYTLTGDTSEEKFLVIGGEGGTGKTSLILSLLTLLGDYGCSLSRHAFTRATSLSDAQRATTQLNPIEGCRFAVSDELDENSVLDSTIVKALTGGDYFAFRRQFEEEHTAKIDAKLFISSNFLPKFNIRDDALLRRLVNVTFTQKFGKAGFPARDNKLKAKLLSQPNIDALLSLLVREAVAWYRDGLLKPSADMIQATEIHKEASDFIGAFLEQFFDGRYTNRVKQKELLSELKLKCKEARDYQHKELRAMVLADSRIVDEQDRERTRYFIYKEESRE